MNTFFKTLMVGAVAIAAVACTDEPQVITPETDAVQDIFVNADGSETSVSRADVDAVVGKMFEKQNKSRSTSYTVSSINDNDGNPTIYVINYANNEGFLLLSATKTHSPILAYANEGNFVGDPFGKTGLSLWQDDMIADIKRTTTLPEDSIAKAKKLWNYYTRFTTDNNFKNKPTSRLDPTSETYIQAQTILQDSITSWWIQGFQTYSITDGFLSDESRCEEIRQEIEFGSYYEYIDDWDVFSVAVRKTRSCTYGGNIGVSSTWGQLHPYNSVYPLLSNGQRAYAGCGPVAAGQIMRYHQWPSGYDWANMPLNTGNTTVSSLLYDIAEAADANYKIGGTSTNISKMKDVFKDMGYSCTYKSSADWDTVRDELYSGRPVYMRGDDSNGVGHAWVVSGYEDIIVEEFVEIYYFPFKNQLQSLYIEDFQDSSLFMQYVNWGWNGSNNGFYTKNSIYVNGTYSSNMKSLINISPIR